MVEASERPILRLAWLSDIHLNFVERPHLPEFFSRLAACDCDGFLLGGDIAEAPSVADYLAQLAESVDVPIYFVLGNHDFYFGSLAEVRSKIRRLCRHKSNLIWLPDAGVVSLSSRTALVGHDGWADARLGDYERSLVMMNDYRLIAELAGMSKAQRWPVLKALGDEAAEHIQRVLPQALARHDHVVLLTHVPPLREACWYQGQTSNDEWLPHFTCYAMGKAILEIMQQHPNSRLTVLCGHTHSPGECRPLANVKILTGRADYGQPEIQDVLQVM